MKSITREQAIKRIREIFRDENIEHLTKSNSPDMDFVATVVINEMLRIAAAKELMYIFDIKAEELK